MTLDQWWAALRWQIAHETGWTLEYIESLTLESIWEFLSVKDGNVKADNHQIRQASRRARRGRRR